MPKRSKRYKECLEKVPDGPVPTAEGVKIVKEFKAAKFNQTIELVMHLGIDPRHADQAIRGSISLPHGIGASRKVIAFCDGEDVAKAVEAGAVEAGGEELVKKIQDGWLDFDVAVASPPMMKVVSRLGRLLGPQGKMPSPKAGTVTADVAKAVREYAAGKVEYRSDDGGNLHMPVGKSDFSDEMLQENVDTLVGHIKGLRPASTKGTYIKKVCLAATMSPSVEVQVH